MTENKSEEILRVEKVKKTYQSGSGYINAVNDVSFNLHQSEILAIMGSSGSGKTTMLNIIGGLGKPEMGKIYINHLYEKKYFIEPFASEFRSRNIGFVFQAYNLLNEISVEENLELPLLLQKMEEEEMEVLAYEAYHKNQHQIDTSDKKTRNQYRKIIISQS